MQLLTTAAREALPPLGGSDERGGPVVQVKFFTPDAGWTWYAAEFDGSDTFWGVVDGLELEFGTFSVMELQVVRGSLGLPVERDRFFPPLSPHPAL